MKGNGVIVDRRFHDWNRAVSIALQIGLAIVIAVFCCCRSRSYELVDLTHPIDNESITWPGGPEFEMEILHRGDNGKGYWAEANAISLAEHTGTHFDAPSHFQEHGWRLHEVPPERFFGKDAVMIDISERGLNQDRDTELTVQDVSEWEAQHGIISQGSAVIVRTGWGEFYSNKTLYLGTSENDASKLHFPGIGREAARVLALREIHVIGIDTASIDHGQSLTFDAHRELYQHNIVGVENLNNLDRLPTRGAKLYLFPVHIHGGSGSPCRAIAEIPVEYRLKDLRLGWIFALVLLVALACLTLTQS